MPRSTASSCVQLAQPQPRELNVRAEFLSHVSAMPHYGYGLRAELLHALDALRGPHSIVRFARLTIASRCRPHTGRSHSHYYTRRRMPSQYPGRAKTFALPPPAAQAPAGRGWGPYARFGRMRHQHRPEGAVGATGRSGGPSWGTVRVVAAGQSLSPCDCSGTRVTACASARRSPPGDSRL